MKHWKPKVLALIFVIFAGYVLFNHMNLNPLYPESAFMYCVLFTAVFLVFTLDSIGRFVVVSSGSARSVEFVRSAHFRRWPLVTLAVLWGLFFAVSIGSSVLFQVRAYRTQMPELTEMDFAADFDTVNTDQLPIVDENTTEQDARNNPRVSREKMAEFILSDLDFAEEHIGKLEETSKTLPHLAAVYGLKARLYMWLEEYGNAQTYAEQAITASQMSPMTEDQCLNTSSGFNNISCWMWGSQMVAEDNVVQTGILNWASWMSNETSFGYSGQAPFIQIGKSLYDRLSDTDFRKKMWKAPEGEMLDGETEFLTSASFGYFGDRLPEYASVKFRPAEGNCDDYTVGAATAYPLMRVEEMYFIRIEAAAQQGNAQAQTMLVDFMQQYRDPDYVVNLSGDELIDEIVFQKRIELWGEGQTFFDVKRLNMPVTRGYEGTNFSDAARFNTDGRPAWMNICIVQTEKNNNAALIGFENPDPSGTETLWVDPSQSDDDGEEESGEGE